MKGHIAFCPHFHQPHFQLFRTREEAFKNSYRPWLQLLSQAVNLDDFYINIHFSGPFLYWLRDTKAEFLDQFNTLLESKKIGLLGGLADEPFIQLSSRPDDVLYQMQKYDELLTRVTGVTAADWQGIHLVERECGEMLLYQATQAARRLKAEPIFYLDAETFYVAHFSYPGASDDYCLKHFGFKDPVAKTTISHLPQSLLFFALRDEINGQEFVCFPVHSQFRYQLLKKDSFTSEDRVIIKPKHYYFYIKDALEQAYEQVRKLGKPLEPLLVIFEDAEKFGQWSKDPQGDREWLMEFFTLVDRDPDLKFTGLKDYLHEQGFLDTYPVSSSHSYPEWENWTARRGIRGVTFGDERLRKVICRLRDAEALQNEFETAVLQKLEMTTLAPELAQVLHDSLLASSQRYQLVEKILESHYPDWLELYRVVNRVRHLVYQEDPKWASRHPSYGSSPFYDMQGLAYLELAMRVLTRLLQELNISDWWGTKVKDWDMDGQDEIVIENRQHSLILDQEGGCITYQHVIEPQAAQNSEQASQLLLQDFKRLRAYNHIYSSSYPLVMTESDSDLKRQFYPEGGRVEVPRNSMRCAIWIAALNQEVAVGEFDTCKYSIDSVEVRDGKTLVKMSKQTVLDLIGHDPLTISLVKEFLVDENSLQVQFHAYTDRVIDALKFYMVPELVTSASPSDEVSFQPCAWLGTIPAQEGDAVNVQLRDVVSLGRDGLSYFDEDQVIEAIAGLDYYYRLDSADGSSHYNMIRYQLEGDHSLQRLEIRPAVSHYYRDYVFPEQSRLSYHTSGLMIRPWIPFVGGQASLTVNITWGFDIEGNQELYREVIPLIRECTG